MNSRQRKSRTLKTLTQGKNSENVFGLMAKTFKALAELADWSSSTVPPPAAQPPDAAVVAHEDDPGKQLPAKHVAERESSTRLRLKELHYNIQIVLPETRDVAVFDAIFESLKKHLPIGLRPMVIGQDLQTPAQHPGLMIVAVAAPPSKSDIRGDLHSRTDT